MKYWSWELIKNMLIMMAIIAGLLAIDVAIVQLKRKAKEKISKKIASVKTKGGVCPKCGGELIMREGKYGSFIGCSNFPKCRYTQK